MTAVGFRHRRIVSLLASAVMASMLANATAGTVAAPLNLMTIAGVYKTRHPNGSVTGEKWISEDILELEPITPTSTYFKAHFEFFNAHQCALHGVADVEGDTLVYLDRSEDAKVVGGQCVLRLHLTKDRLTFEDPAGACKRMYCGERGAWNGLAIERSRRRPIRYRERLIHSEDYWSARMEHDAPSVATRPARR